MAAIAGTSRADLVTVDGTFLSFTSYIGTDRTSFVNGVALTPSATQINPSRYLSDPVTLAAGTTRTDFNYDPMCCGAVTPIPWLVNSFEFIAAPPADVNRGDTFQLGTFRFTNGQWWEEADLAFRLTSHSANTALDNHIFEGTLHLTSVSAIPTFVDPTADALAEADYFYVLERPDLGSMRVFDKIRQPPGNPGYSGDFALDGKIGSLIPTGFVALNGAGFTNPSVEPGLSATSVPEPGTLTLFGISLGLLAAGGTMRRKSAGRTQ